MESVQHHLTSQSVYYERSSDAALLMSLNTREIPLVYRNAVITHIIIYIIFVFIKS